MQADISRDGGRDLCSTTVGSLFRAADSRIRCVRLDTPKLAIIGATLGLVCQVLWETRETTPVHLTWSPVQVAPPVHLGWDTTSPTADAWTHAVEKVP